MKKPTLTLQYILALLCCPKKAAEAVNAAGSVEELDGRVREL